MTTKSTKPVTRESSAFVRERGLRALIVTIHGSVLHIRPKGLHSEETITLDACYSMAVKSRVMRERADRRKATQ